MHRVYYTGYIREGGGVNSKKDVTFPIFKVANERHLCGRRRDSALIDCFSQSFRLVISLTILISKNGQVTSLLEFSPLLISMYHMR